MVIYYMIKESRKLLDERSKIQTVAAERAPGTQLPQIA